MSLEGIRIVSEDETRDGNAAEPQLPVDVTIPQKVRVLKTEGKGVEIDWRDGHKIAWSFAWLRNACPFAMCQVERDRTGREQGADAGKPKTEVQKALAIYEAPIRSAEVTPVGKYALKVKWSDGHQTGFYSWNYLRRICQCAICEGST
jgi:DUF971 family protein